jgi:C4-dicarboxylate transporter DctQ subunit
MKWIERIEENVIGVSLLFATLMLCINVTLRYLFNANLTWAEELIRYVMIWITFIGSSVCFRRGMHVGIDFILSFTSKSTSRFIHIFVAFMSVIFMLFMFKYSLDLFLFTKNTGQITPALQIPLYWVYLAIPLSSFLSIIHLISILVKLIRNNEVIETSTDTVKS